MPLKVVATAFLLVLACRHASAYDFLITTNNNDIYGVDIDECSKTLLGSFDVVSIPFGDITYTPDGRLWGITTNGWIYELDLELGFAFLTSMVPPDFPIIFITGMTADEHGLIYLAAGSQYIYTFNPETEEWANLGATNYGSAGDLTYIDGQMIMAGSGGQIILIDQDSIPNSAPLLDLPLVYSVFGMVTTVENCEVKGTYLCTAVETGVVYEIDFETGLTDQICVLNEYINGAASRFEFLQAAPLGISAADTITIDCNQPLASIEVTTEGGACTLSYQLNQQPLQESNIFEGLFPGTYTISVRDAFGCSKSVTVEVVETEPVPRLLQIEVENDTCGIGGGSISLEVQGGTPPYSFSLDDGNLQTSPFFSNLTEGNYLLQIADSVNCGFTREVSIQGNPPLILQADPLGCGPGRGSITLGTTGGSRADVWFILEGNLPQSANVFDNLDAGEYIVIALDELGCTDSISVTIPLAEPVEIGLEDSQVCGPGQNFIAAAVQNGTAPVTYYLNGAPKSNGLFDTLSNGVFILEAKDGRGCWSGPLRVELPDVDPLSVSTEVTASATCGEPNGEVILSTTGGTAPYEYAMEGVYQSSPQLQSLPVGTVSFQILDAEGCMLADTVHVPTTCNIYVPSAFSPNGDQTNERFQLYSGQPFQVVSYRIFNTWGQPIYEAKDFPSTAVERFWDGRGKNELLNSDVFVYRIEVINFLGEQESFIGDLTLKR